VKREQNIELIWWNGFESPGEHNEVIIRME